MDGHRPRRTQPVQAAQSRPGIGEHTHKALMLESTDPHHPSVPHTMSLPRIQLVVAYSDNRVIGRDNALPWRLPTDLAHFKRVTLGQPIVMGRNTWESLGRPLPGRPNLVVSRNAAYQAPGATVYPSVEAALADCADAERICVIGGEQIFQITLPIAHEIIATEVHAQVEGDTFFPPIDPAAWMEINRSPQAEENGYAFDFVTYARTGE